MDGTALLTSTKQRCCTRTPAVIWVFILTFAVIPLALMLVLGTVLKPAIITNSTHD